MGNRLKYPRLRGIDNSELYRQLIRTGVLGYSARPKVIRSYAVGDTVYRKKESRVSKILDIDLENNIVHMYTYYNALYFNKFGREYHISTSVLKEQFRHAYK